MSRASLIVLDLETHPTRDPYTLAVLENEARMARPAHNTKVAIKAEWDTQEAEDARAADAVAKSALDTALAELLCVVLAAPGVVDHPAALKAFSAMAPACDETVCLSELSHWLQEHTDHGTVWAGHNIRSFDLQVLLNRWRRHGIRPPDYFPVFRAGRWDGNVYDTMTEFPCKTGFISLSSACRILGLPNAKPLEWNGKPMHGGLVKQVYDAGDYTFLVDYCACDVQAELALYNAMTFEGTWGVKRQKEPKHPVPWYLEADPFADLAAAFPDPDEGERR